MNCCAMDKEQGVNTRTAVACWLATFGYMGLIFFLSSLVFDVPDLPENSDKVIHTGVYLLLAMLFYISFRKSGMKRNVFVWSIILTGLYGATDEIHQYFVPGRNADVYDVLADFSGALIGSTASRFLKIY